MKIGHKLIAGFIGITLFVGFVIGGISVKVSQDALRTQIEREPAIYNDLIIRSLDVLISGLMNEFRGMSVDPRVVSALTQSNDQYAAQKDVQDYIELKESEFTGVPVGEIRRGTETEFKENIKQELKQELKQEIKAEAKKEIEAELKQELKAEMKAEVKEQVKEKIEQVLKTSPKPASTPAAVQALMSNTIAELLRKNAVNYERKYEIENFGRISLTNKYGAVIAMTKNVVEFRYDKTDWWQAAKEKGIYIGNVKFREDLGIYAPGIAIRIEDADRNFIGVLRLVPNINIINRTIQASIAETYKKVDLKILDETGSTIYSTGVADTLMAQFSLFKQIDKKAPSGSFLSEGGAEAANIYVYSRTRSQSAVEGLNWICVARLDATSVLEPVAELKDTIKWVSAIVIIIAVGLGFPVSRSLITPLKQLTDAMVEISKGNFKVELPAQMLDSKDEIGDLAKSFSRMVAALRFFMEKEIDDPTAEESVDGDKQ